MSTTTGTIVLYESWSKYIGEGSDMSSDTFKIGLTTSAYVPSASTHEVLTNITNELSGNGYAQQTLGSLTWAEVSGTTTFDFADPIFTASGGSLVARFFFIFNETMSTPVVDPLICYGLLDDTPGDVTATDGNTITLNVNGAGLFTLS